MKFLLIVWVVGGYSHSVTTEKFATKAECERVGKIVTEEISITLGSESYKCIELLED